MEDYKRHLCSYFNYNCTSEDTIYDFIKDNAEYKYFLNEKGNLHSNYTGSYYEPAVIHINAYPPYIQMFWLFDGEIKDCIHPFYILITSEQIHRIIFYSSERIQTGQPIRIHYAGDCQYACYNYYIDNSNVDVRILSDYAMLNGHDGYDCLFTSEFYPLCEEMDSPQFRFKFAD